jgi:Tfp pilus assembly protein PilF
MKKRLLWRPLALAVSAFAIAGAPASAATAATATAAAAQLQPLLTAAQIDFTSVDPLYRETIARDGGIDGVVVRLQQASKDESKPKRQRSNALLVASYLQWRYGLRPAAQTSVEEALQIETNAGLALQEARLLEAAGELAQAQRWYEQAFDLTTDPASKEDLRLRMTFVAAGEQNVEALVQLAQRRDRGFRNRAAVALALLNRYGEAAGLYEAYGEAGDRFPQHLRLAQWALEAGNVSAAQEEAWKAVQFAALDRDQRYALSVLVEAHEADNSMDRLLDRFETKGTLSAAEQDIHIGLLQKLGRYDEAIRLLNASGITQASRRQLLRMYSEAGRTQEMVTEYAKLSAAEPEQVAWPEGLSQYLMEHGERAGAMQVWQEFIDRNTHSGTLLAGASAMVRFGFDELAVAATTKCIAIEPGATSKALLFRFELDLRRGRTDAAAAVLATMDKTLPDDSPDRIELANAYERIKKPLQALGVLEALDKHRAGGLGADERMRMAWLYDSSGQRDRALAVWKGLWNGRAPDASRRLIEDRLVTLAAETGTLGDLAVELEAKLADGTAGKKDSALLIRIYTDTNDSASAIEVIREYFRRSGNDAKADVASLREQANVYRTLGRYRSFQAVTMRLLELDPDNKVDYLQSLVLNQLENGGEPGSANSAQLKQWLTQLRDTGGAAAGAEFEAGILVLAGMEDEAIAVYRRVLARNPEQSDNYLQFADLLKKRSLEPEAIAALQYLVETAKPDDAFIAGVDGILNMRPKDKSVIEWAQRRVLERLAARGDKLYLYELLGELAEESGNNAMYLAALENSLVYADSRRSNVLRELITASTERSVESMMMGSGAAGKPDPARKLRYSRRLISLGEELPPEVYTEMGGTFLKMGDAENAADAFNRAVDDAEDGKLLEKTGDLFRDEGFTRQAGAQYEKALIADADNAGVMRKLADMRMRQGDTGEAQNLYARALMNVLNGLPQEIEKGAQTTPPDFDNTVSYEYRENYAQLATNLLYALPSGEQPFAAFEKSFDAVLRQSLQGVNGQSAKELAYYPRLNAFSRFMRDAALRSGRYELADAVDSRLLSVFGTDEQLVAELVNERRQWRLPASAALLAAQAQGSTAEKAVAGGQYERAIDGALYDKDQALALSVYRDWVKEVIQAARADAADPRAARGDGRRDPVRIISNARARLDAQSYASLCRYVIDLIRGRPEYQRKFLGDPGYFRATSGSGASSLLLDMEKAAGRIAMSEAELRSLIANAEQEPQPDGQIDMIYVQSRLPAADLIDLFVRNMEAEQREAQRLPLAMRAFGAALTKTLTPQQSARLLDAFKQGVQKQIKSDSYSVEGVVTLLQHENGSIRDMAPANAAVLEAIDDFLAATYPKTFTAGAVRIDALVAAGRAREAMPLIVDSALARFAADATARDSAVGVSVVMTAGPIGGEDSPLSDNVVRQYLQQYVKDLYPQYAAELRSLVRAKETELGLTPAVFALLAAVEECDPQSTRDGLMRWTESMAKRYPDNEPVLSALAQLHGSLGYTDLQMKSLERLVALAPRNIEYRKDLFDAWQWLANPANALASTDGRLDDVLRGSANPTRQVMARRNNDSLLRPTVSKPIEQIMALEKGGSVEQARMGLRSLMQQLPPDGEAPQVVGGDEGARPLRFEALFNLDWRLPGTAKNETGADESPEGSAAMPTSDAFFQSPPPVAGGRTGPQAGERQCMDALAGESSQGCGSTGLGRGLYWPVEALAREDTPRDTYSRQGKFLDKLIDYEFTIEEFEAEIRTFRLQDLDSQYLLYSLLADAYEKHGRLQTALASLTAKVESGAAGGKELILWLEVLCRLPPQQVAALLPLVQKTVPAAQGSEGYERVLLARTYARAGDENRATDIYSAAVMSRLFGIGGQRGFGRPVLTTASDLYVDASQHLGPEGLRRFSGKLLEILEPRNAAVAASGVYEQFVMWMLARTPQLQPAQERFRARVQATTNFEHWSGDALLQAASLLARQGQPETALKLMALTLQPPPQGQPRRNSFQDEPAAVGQYRSALGLESADADAAMRRHARSNVMRFKILFPVRADAWPGAREWTERAASQLADWIEQGAVEREPGLQVLALATLRLNQVGAQDAALASARKLSRLLVPYERTSQPAATLAVAVMEHIQAPLDTAMLRGLIEHRRLDVHLLAPVLRRVAAADGAAQSIALGELAVAYTQEPNLLQTLKTLAGRPDPQGQ